MASSNSPCAACKCLRRKCTQECVFAPYFPPDQPQRFSNVHKVFGASNVAKLFNELNPSQREDAVNSLAYEAEARLRDPVYGCVGLISILQHRLKQLQSDLFNAKKELSTYIAPSAMMPIYQPPNYNNASGSAGVMPYGMAPMGGPSGGDQLVIREAQAAQAQATALAHVQLIEAQQLAAMGASREDLEMMRNWELQQQQQFLRYNGGGGGGGYEAAAAVVAASVGGGGGGGGGFNQNGAQPGVGSPSLALGGPAFDHNNNAYHNQHDHQQQHPHPHHEQHLQIQQQPQDEDQPQEPLLLLQQPEPLDHEQQGGHGGGGGGTGREVQVGVVAQAIPLPLQPQHNFRHLHLHHQHNQQHISGSTDQEGKSTVGPSC